MGRLKCAILIAVAGCCWLDARCDTSRPAVFRRKLEHTTEIQGYSCAKGYAWFYAAGQLERCGVSRETVFGDAHVPAGSIIVLRPNGSPRYCFLSHDTLIAGYRVMGPGWLPVAEGVTTAFYPSGKLKSIYLVEDQAIQGVPCRSGQWGIFTDPFGGGNHVEFYETGKLRGCKLTRDFSGVRRGQRFIQAP
jgi:antitoxin component YwqK of YwqJK toxin-antitoxin module